MGGWILWLLGRRREDDYSVTPPFDLAFGGVVRNSADKTVHEDRIRVGVFRPRHSKKCKDCGRACRWLVIELLDSDTGKWTHVLSMQESRLPILLSVLGEVADYLVEDAGGPKSLPTVSLWGKRFFIDERLSELRNIDDPHDRVLLQKDE